MQDVDYTDEFLDRLEEAGAKMLIEAALVLQQQATADYHAGSNPPPYVTPAPRGTFPRVRTGFLAGNILIRPTAVSAVRRGRVVRVGYAAAAFYGIALGNRGWKWLEDSLRACESRMAAACEGVGVFGLN